MGDNSCGNMTLYQSVRDTEKDGENVEIENGNEDDGNDDSRDYCFVVDVSRIASLQRSLKWGGLKQVSNLNKNTHTHTNKK